MDTKERRKARKCKSTRITLRNRYVNLKRKGIIKFAFKSINKMCESGKVVEKDRGSLNKKVSEYIKLIHRGCTKGLFHLNKARRMQSRITKMVNGLQK